MQILRLRPIYREKSYVLTANSQLKNELLYLADIY